MNASIQSHLFGFQSIDPDKCRHCDIKRSLHEDTSVWHEGMGVAKWDSRKTQLTAKEAADYICVRAPHLEHPHLPYLLYFCGDLSYAVVHTRRIPGGFSVALIDCFYASPSLISQPKGMVSLGEMQDWLVVQLTKLTVPSPGNYVQRSLINIL